MSELVGDARHLSPSTQEALRLWAVAALVEGRVREDVAAMFKVSLKAVDGWWAKWLGGGRDALVARPRGRQVGEHQALSEAEQAAVRQAVLDHQPCDLGLRGQLWTRGQIGALIAKLYRVRLTEPGVGKYSRRWGLSFQRPDKRAVEQDPRGRARLAGGDLRLVEGGRALVVVDEQVVAVACQGDQSGQVADTIGDDRQTTQKVTQSELHHRR